MPTSRGRNHVLHASGTTPRRAKTKPIFGAVEGGDELTDDGRVDGVEPVGAVERERRDPVRGVVEQRLEGYQNPRARTSLPPAATAASGAAGAAIASFLSSGMTSLANSRM